MSQAAQRQITVAEMAPHVHSFLPGENKVNKISDWLINWIKNALIRNQIKPYDLLPSKGDLAFHTGVSIGTIQNVFRHVEDCGLIESKQRIGTYIKKNDDKEKNEKLTSKREVAVELIKQFILENNYKLGEKFISSRKLSELIGISNTTVRLAIGTLVLEKILKQENNNFIIANIDFQISEKKAQTLVLKLSEKLKKYILENFNPGDKLSSNYELAQQFNVSVKTIHDTIKQLSKEGILYTCRGQYGTIVAGDKNAKVTYCYEDIENKLRAYISENCEIGSKLPSIIELSKIYQTSTKTIKRALDNLSEEGYVTFTRGRYGGTYITDIPQGGKEAYKWLAISSEYASDM